VIDSQEGGIVMRIHVAIAFMIVSTFWTSTAFARKWTDSTGKYTVEADLVDFKDGVVQLRRSDNGRVISLPLSRLSRTDQTHVRETQSRKSGAGGVTGDQRRQKEKAALALLGQAASVTIQASGSVDDVVGAYSLAQDLANSKESIAEWLPRMRYVERDASRAGLVAYTTGSTDIAKVRGILGKEDAQGTGTLEFQGRTLHVTWYKFGWLQFGAVEGKIGVIRADLRGPKNVGTTNRK